MHKKPELYVSIDIETDGPAPGWNSMLALGAALFGETGELVTTFYDKLVPLAGTHPNKETMDWWKTQPEAWEEVSTTRRLALTVMEQFVGMLDHYSYCSLVPVAWPAAFDFSFVNYYCHRFAGRNPLGYACLDIRSYIDGLLNSSLYYGKSQENVESAFGHIEKEGLRPHIAVDDALWQGRLFMAARRYAAEMEQMK